MFCFPMRLEVRPRRTGGGWRVRVESTSRSRLSRVRPGHPWFVRLVWRNRAGRTYRDALSLNTLRYQVDHSSAGATLSVKYVLLRLLECPARSVYDDRITGLVAGFASDEGETPPWLRLAANGRACTEGTSLVRHD